MLSIVKEHFIEIAQTILAIVGGSIYFYYFFYLEYRRKKIMKEFGKETQAVVTVVEIVNDPQMGTYYNAYFKLGFV